MAGAKKCWDESTQRFINTDLFSPVIKYGLYNVKAHWGGYRPPDYKKWWAEQKLRCEEGYTVGGVYITGDYYWYLNFWRIKGISAEDKAKHGKKAKKKLIPPRFLDIDKEFFDEVEKARNEGKHMCILKRRQCGYSEKVAGLIGKEYTFHSHSESLILAGESKYSDNTMKMVQRGLNALAWSGPEFWKRTLHDTLGFMESGYKVTISGEEVKRGYRSTIWNITCKDDDQATIGKSPSFVLFEETGKFKNASGTYRYLKPSMEAEGITTCFCIMIGTGGEMDKGVTELMHVFYHPESFNMLEYPNNWEESVDAEDNVCGYFVPAWKYLIIDEWGNSMRGPSEVKIKADREKALKSKKKGDYTKELTQMPMNPEEAFLMGGEGAFNRDKLNKQRHRIMTDKKLRNLGQRGDLNWIYNDEQEIIDVAWTPNEDGIFLVFEHPQRDKDGSSYINLYHGGTDSYDKPKAATSTSKGSCSIYKSFINAESSHNLFAARMTWRPARPDDFYEATAKMCYYFNAMNLIEWSNISIFNWYITNGFEWMLKERPMVAYANVKDSKATNKYGIDPSTKFEWIKRYGQYIEDHADKMYDMEQIVKAARYDDTVNCDITISSSLAVLNYEDVKAYSVVTTSESEHYEEELYGYRLENGVLKVVG
jgi:hypothetical protein